MSTGIHGYGAVLKMGSAASSVASLANISSISGPNMTRDSVDISTLTSTNITKEFIPGLVDGGEITCELNYNETDAVILTGTTYGINNHYPVYWEIEFPDTASISAASSFNGAGFITSLGHTLDTGSKISQSVTIKLTGAVTYSTAA
jgi:hypothetical protein